MGNVCGCRDKLDDKLDDFDDIEESPKTALSPLLFNLNKSNSLDDQATILTYNIFVRPPPVNNYGDDYKSERLIEFLKTLPNYDIICLQEMFQSLTTRRKKMIKLAKKAGFKYFAESPSPDFFSSMFCDGGLLTMSRHPILASEFRPFPQGIGPDYIVLKGILYTKIKVEKGILHIFSTHTQASYTHELKYFLLHVEQFICFRKFVEEMLKKNSYKSQDIVLFVGDFNVDPRENIQHDIQDMKKICPALLRYSSLTNKETFHEYEMLLSVLSDDFRDDIEEVYFAQHGEHPATFGDCYIDENNQKQPRENALTHADYLCSDKRLDFIFKFVPRSMCFNNDEINEKISSDSKFVIQEKSAMIEKFLVDQQKFTQLSDHYGVKVTVKYSDRESTRSDDSTNFSTSPEADKFNVLEKS